MCARNQLFVVAIVLLGLGVFIRAYAAPTSLLPNPEQGLGALNSAAQAQMNVGNEALTRKSLDAAQKAFLDASKLDPKAAPPLLGLAEVARQRNQRAEVEKWLKQALAVAPQSADVQRAWGRYQLAIGNLPGAETALRKSAELAPRTAISYLDLGDLYMGGLNRPRDAEAAYRRAVELQPDSASAHFGLGTALVALGRTDEAVTALETSVKLAPERPQPLLALGKLYTAKQDHTRALVTYDRLLKLQPGFVPALLDRGDIYLMARRDPAAAVVDYERAAKIVPRSPTVQFKLGSAYQALGKLDDAVWHYRAAIAADNKLALAYNNLAAVDAERKRDLDEALKAAKRAIELAPKVNQFYDTLGSVHLARGELDQAIAAFQIAADSKPPNAEHYYHLGVALEQKGLKSEAIGALKQALSVNPGFANAADARRRLAQLDGK
jgi:tetratricopeptide (TPR) repeat protein